MGGFAVFHAEKGKGSGGGLGNHIDRTEGMEHTYPHADPERKHLNVHFELPGGKSKMKLNDAIEDRISEGYKGKRKIRNDAVKYLTHVYTGTHEDMVKIFKNKDTAQKWIQANYDFIAKEFGAKNIVRFTLHMDEKTPHLHAVTVPLTNDGRLSAKEVMGNKKNLQLRQDRYAEVMKPFGLERGIKETGIKHENANDYYKRIEESINTAQEIILEPVQGVFGINKAKTTEKYKESLKSAKMALDDVSKKLERAQIRVKSVQKTSKRYKEELEIAERRVYKFVDKLSEQEKIIKTQEEKIKKATRVFNSIQNKYGIDVQKEIDNDRKRDRNRGRGLSR